MKLNNLLYLLFNSLNVFLVYKSIHKLLYDRIRNKYLEKVTYIIYYLVISTLYLLSYKVDMMITINILLLFLLLFNYDINVKNKMLLLLNLYFILNFVGTVTIIILENTSAFNGEVFKHKYFLSFFIESILYFLALKFLNLLKILNKTNNIEDKIFLPLILVPICSIIIHIIFVYKISNYKLVLFTVFCLILIINISIYILYNSIFTLLENDMKNKILEKENKLYEEQFKNTKKYIETIRRFNHDLKHHLVHIKNLINENNFLDANNYIEDIFELQKNNEMVFINTGNYTIDNIINFKLNEAYKKNIKVSVLANIPYDVNISEFHIVSIIGNLIQNAIEANEKLENDKFIDLNINYKLNKLFITISNRFDKNIKIKNNKLLTTKVNSDEHGIGMSSIYNSVKKFNGEMIYSYDKDIFKVEILLFL